MKDRSGEPETARELLRTLVQQNETAKRQREATIWLLVLIASCLGFVTLSEFIEMLI